VYFTGSPNAAKHVGELSADSANFGYDDERGDYSIVPGDHLSYRYEIIDVLGKGSFGQVVRCIDHKTGGLVAVKIIRNKKRFHQQALVEVNILQKLREWVSEYWVLKSEAYIPRIRKTSIVWSASHRASISVAICAFLQNFWI
jgi:serine/threonine protein kinase